MTKDEVVYYRLRPKDTEDFTKTINKRICNRIKLKSLYNRFSQLLGSGKD